jgi:hypothetical protein
MVTHMDTKDYSDAALAELFARAKAQFGSAVKSYWFYDGEPCPGCGFPVDAMQYKGQDALSLNAFIYRPRGVLIGYALCGLCARQIFQAAEKNPGVQTPLHSVIEANLTKAYQRYLASLDA